VTRNTQKKNTAATDQCSSSMDAVADDDFGDHGGDGKDAGVGAEFGTGHVPGEVVESSTGEVGGENRDIPAVLTAATRNVKE
jgi:hypothetical protein